MPNSTTSLESSSSWRRVLCSCIITCVVLATVSSAAPAAKDADEQSLAQLKSNLAATEKSDVGVGVGVLPPSDVTSVLATLPKMKEPKPSAAETAKNSAQQYDYVVEEPLMDDNIDFQLVEKFVKFLEDKSGTNLGIDQYEWIPEDVDYAAHAPKNNDSETEAESTVAAETEMTPSPKHRVRRSAGRVMAMTAENMMTSPEHQIRSSSRRRRDLNDEGLLYENLWPASNDDQFEYEAGVDYDDTPARQYLSEDGYYPESPSSPADVRRYELDEPAVSRQLVPDEPAETPVFIPVVYRGVKGVFVPATKIGAHQNPRYSAAELRLAGDKWSSLVRDEVKKALDEYDLVYRLAEVLRQENE